VADPSVADPSAADPSAVDPSAVDPSAVDPSAVVPSAVVPSAVVQAREDLIGAAHVSVVHRWVAPVVADPIVSAIIKRINNR
jgi:hypothetical protein